MSTLDSIVAWLQSDFAREPVAWLALFITVIFAVANFVIAQANYKLSRAKYLGEREEQRQKIFSVSIDDVNEIFDPETLERYSKDYKDFWHSGLAAQGLDAFKIDYNLIPRYFSARLNLSNQSSMPVFIENIELFLGCREITSKVTFGFIAKNLPPKDLDLGEAQLVFHEPISRRQILISKKNLLQVDPATIKVLDAIAFISKKAEGYTCDAPSEAYSVSASVQPIKEFPIHTRDYHLAGFVGNKLYAQKRFSRTDSEYAELLQRSFDAES